MPPSRDPKLGGFEPANSSTPRRLSHTDQVRGTWLGPQWGLGCLGQGGTVGKVAPEEGLRGVINPDEGGYGSGWGRLLRVQMPSGHNGSGLLHRN